MSINDNCLHKSKLCVHLDTNKYKTRPDYVVPSEFNSHEHYVRGIHRRPNKYTYYTVDSVLFFT